MIFITAAIWSISTAIDRSDINGTATKWLLGILTFALVASASYAAAWLIGTTIGLAATQLEPAQQLATFLQNGGFPGALASTLLPAPTTILSVIFIPKWTFHIFARGRLPQQTRDITHNDAQKPAEDEQVPLNVFPEAHPDQHETKTRRIPPIFIASLICFTVGAAATTGIFLLLNNQPDEAIVQAPATPTPTPQASPTPTLIPTYTPAPTPTPTLAPTYTARPTVKVYAPSPTPVNPGEPYIQAFASCNGKYQGEQRLGRENAARTTLQSGLRTLEGLAAVIQEKCPPPDTSPTPAPTPAVAKLATTTPIPTITPQHTVTSTPNFPTHSPATTSIAARSHPTTFQQFQNARWLSQNNPELSTRMQSIPWVSDGLDYTEAEVVKYLLYLAVKDQQNAVSDIIAMPFLTSIEPADLSAIRSIWGIYSDSQDQYYEIINNPLFSQGLTNEWTPIVATLSSAAQRQPELIQVLLNVNRVTIETKRIHLPLSGDVRLDIVRMDAAAPARTMRLLEHAVRTVESFMGFPIPTNHIVVLFADVVTTGKAGHNSGSHIAIKPEYDVDDGSHEAESLPPIIAHEVAHYYWSDNANWVDEGLADLTASMSEFARNGSTIAVTNQPCPYLDTIEELQARLHLKSDATHSCNYTLGERLFIELYQTHDDMPFRQRLRQLYLASIPDDGTSSPGTAVGIDHVRTIFGDTLQGSKIIRRWYNGEEPFDTTRIDRSTPKSRIPSINGNVKSADLVLTTNTQPIQQFSASRHTGYTYVRFKYDHNVSGSPREHPLTLIEYYEDGHQTNRQSVTITADPRYNNSSWTYHFSVGPPDQWKPGQYWAMLYDGSEKIAQVQWIVQP